MQDLTCAKEGCNAVFTPTHNRQKFCPEHSKAKKPKSDGVPRPKQAPKPRPKNANPHTPDPLQTAVQLSRCPGVESVRITIDGVTVSIGAVG